MLPLSLSGWWSRSWITSWAPLTPKALHRSHYIYSAVAHSTTPSHSLLGVLVKLANVCSAGSAKTRQIYRIILNIIHTYIATTGSWQMVWWKYIPATRTRYVLRMKFRFRLLLVGCYRAPAGLRFSFWWSSGLYHLMRLQSEPGILLSYPKKSSHVSSSTFQRTKAKTFMSFGHTHHLKLQQFFQVEHKTGGRVHVQ